MTAVNFLKQNFILENCLHVPIWMIISLNSDVLWTENFLVKDPYPSWCWDLLNSFSIIYDTRKLTTSSLFLFPLLWPLLGQCEFVCFHIKGHIFSRMRTFWKLNFNLLLILIVHTNIFNQLERKRKFCGQSGLSLLILDSEPSKRQMMNIDENTEVIWKIKVICNQ